MSYKNDVDVKAVCSRIKGSVTKLSGVVNLIRSVSVSDAMNQLLFCRKKRAALEIRNVLRSAIANAENNMNIDSDELYVKEIYLGKAFAIRRFRARARGRGARICKSYSRVTIRLSILQ